MFGGGFPPRRAAAKANGTQDRQSRLRAWLESVTVENGFTPAEEATARQKLTEIGDPT